MLHLLTMLSDAAILKTPNELQSMDVVVLKK